MMVMTDSSTARFAIGMKRSTPKMCPMEDTRHSPVDVMTKKV
ncbi:MAG: hypothetical protein BWX45_01176 [Deltaproteobacteria bacterium ADurb.Bin002]|nr:MAG: hypothetical protein BWX45_01176 [Deltaproteobacteria bacterium ADurb.Bin002]